MRTLLALAAAVLFVVAGCGASHERAVSAELAMPHGETTWKVEVAVPGRTIGVFVGADSLPQGPKRGCIGKQLAGWYRPTANGVTVFVDDDDQRCLTATAAAAIVGGYGAGGGYVGEWLPIAVTYR